MARRMATTVVVRNPDTGAPTAFVAGSEAPEWAERVITNEAVFEPVEQPKPARRRKATEDDE